MNTMCNVIKPFICPKCNQDTLFFLTKNNNLIDYKLLIDKQMTFKEIKDFLRTKNIKYIKCINCNKIFFIDWRDDKYPTALNNIDCLKDFGVL